MVQKELGKISRLDRLSAGRGPLWAMLPFGLHQMGFP